MFRIFAMGRSGTCRPKKNHVKGSKREQFSDYTMKTLGSGDLLAAVRIPDGEDLNEWLAANTVDFFNELRLIWDIVVEVGVEPVQAGQGFPAGFEYRWAENKNMTPIACSGPQYVDHVLSWVERETANEEVFPTSAATPFPRNFVTTIKTIFTRFFRVFAIIYTHHYTKLEQVGGSSHLNTSFKHFLYFVWEFDLVANTELEALKDLVEEIRTRYQSSRTRK